MKKIFFVLGILIATSAVTVNAQKNTATNTGRQVSQQARIQQGKRSGELNRAETARLQREQKKIQIEKRIANADGNVTPAEKRFIRREQNRANKHIARQKHDGQGR